MNGIWRVERVEGTHSTQDLVRHRAEDGEPQGLAIQALCQTGGRGRLGREWVSPPGNLYVSVLLRPEVGLDRMGELAFVCGLALAQGAGRFTDGRELSLKWPNDLLLDNRKAAGILIETGCDREESPYAVAGFGINVNTPPDGAVGVGVGASPSVDLVLEALLESLSECLIVWARDGFAPVREAWLEKAAGVGRPIRVRTAQGTMAGVFRTLDPSGALVLDGPGGLVEIVRAGEILMEPSRKP